MEAVGNASHPTTWQEASAGPPFPRSPLKPPRESGRTADAGPRFGANSLTGGGQPPSFTLLPCRRLSPTDAIAASAGYKLGSRRLSRTRRAHATQEDRPWHGEDNEHQQEEHPEEEHPEEEHPEEGHL